MKDKLVSGEALSEYGESHRNGKGVDEVRALEKELRLKDDEVRILKRFVFNDEVRDTVEEFIQISRDLEKAEHYLTERDKRGKSIEREDRRSRNAYEELKVRKKTLEEDISALKNQETARYDNIHKLEKQNSIVRYYLWTNW